VQKLVKNDSPKIKSADRAKHHAGDSSDLGFLSLAANSLCAVRFLPVSGKHRCALPMAATDSKHQGLNTKLARPITGPL